MSNRTNHKFHATGAREFEGNTVQGVLIFRVLAVRGSKLAKRNTMCRIIVDCVMRLIQQRVDYLHTALLASASKGGSPIPLHGRLPSIVIAISCKYQEATNPCLHDC